MEKSRKNSAVWLIGAMGFIFLLIGIFTDFYSVGMGIVIAVVFWIAAGFVTRFWGMERPTA